MRQVVQRQRRAKQKLQRLEERAAAEREEAAKSAKAHEQALSKLEQESRAEEEAHEQTRAKLKAARDELESSPRDSLLRELRDEKRRLEEDVSRLGARLRSNQESERKAREESFRRVEDVFKRARQGAGLEAQ